MWIEWEKLPRKTMSAAALFFDANGKFIITKPNYKEGWNLPGGNVDAEESPTDAFIREVREELSLEKKPVRLLCVDYIKKASNGHDHVNFVFDGGTLAKNEIGGIKLQAEELDEYKFVPLEEAEGLLAPNWAKRIAKCIEAHRTGGTVYLEDGSLV